jgi:hypothetical protein
MGGGAWLVAAGWLGAALAGAAAAAALGGGAGWVALAAAFAGMAGAALTLARRAPDEERVGRIE